MVKCKWQKIPTDPPLLSDSAAICVSPGIATAEDNAMQSNLRRFLRRAALALALLPMATGHVRADTWFPLNQGYYGVPGAKLGSSIAVGVGLDAQGRHVANRVYVGQPFASDGTLAECGSVQVYAPGAGGWVLAATLYASSRQAGAHFGASLAYSSGHLVVGAPDYAVNGNNRGYAEFLFDNGASTPAIVSKSTIFGTGGNLGSAVAVNVDMAAVARPSAVGGCIQTFHFSVSTQSWSGFPAVNYEVCSPNPGVELGAAVAILRTGASNFLLVAGAPGENTLTGAAHVYIPNPDTGAGGFVEVGTLAADNPGSFDFFGTSVGIDNQYIYVGATGRDNGAGRVGSVTIFKPGAEIGYDNLAEYFPAAPATLGGHCGASLSVDAANSQFILGCPDSDDPYYTKVGNARVYRQFTFLGQPVWLESVLGYGTQTHGANFSLGASVAIVGDQAFAGAPNAHFPAQTGNGAWKAFVPDEIFRDGFGP